MLKIQLTDSDIKSSILSIIQKIDKKPDLIVGLCRGGLIPATMLSHWFKIPMLSVNLSLRDNTVINGSALTQLISNLPMYERILIVDDINDTGETLSYITTEIAKHSNSYTASIETAVIVNNMSSDFSPTYWGQEINKAESPSWIIFPWEAFWILQN